MNPYTEFYVNQSGGALQGYSGVRYQRGHGFFSKMFSVILPALKYLGKQALHTGVNIAEDVLDGSNLRESALKRTAESGRETAKTAIKRARTYAQTGKGCKKRKKRKVAKRNVPKKPYLF